MRVNVYAEEMTDRVEIISKEIDGRRFTGLRLYLELPATEVRDGEVRQVQGPFMHHPGDDDSAAVTFWGKRDLRVVLRKMLAELDAHYAITQQYSTAKVDGYTCRKCGVWYAGPNGFHECSRVSEG
jgi:hypothetical protein